MRALGAFGLWACVFATAAPQAACGLRAPPPASSVADIEALLQVQLELEPVPRVRDEAPASCDRSRLEERCSSHRFRSTLARYRAELERHGALLEALERRQPEASDVAELAPHIASVVEDLAVSRARFLDVLDLEPLPEPPVAVGGAKAAHPVAVVDAEAEVEAPLSALQVQRGGRSRSMQAEIPTDRVFGNMTVVHAGLTDILVANTSSVGAAAKEHPAASDVVPGTKKRTKIASEAIVSVVFSALLVVLLYVACVLFSIVRLSDDVKRSVTGTSPSQPSRFTRQIYLQMVLPYWVPYDSSSRGLLLVFLVVVCVVFSFAMTFWVTLWFFHLGHFVWPQIVHRDMASWLHTAGMRGLATAGVIVCPGVFWCLRHHLQGRKLQWMLLALKLTANLVENMWLVSNSFITRSAMDAIQSKDPALFWMSLKCGTIGSVAVAALRAYSDYVLFRIIFSWRIYMTRATMDMWMDNRRYYLLDDKVDNPDERLQHEIYIIAQNHMFIVHELFCNGLSIFSFVLVLWNITPTLTFACLGYAAAGSLFSLLLMWVLVVYTYRMAGFEASWRFALGHIRHNCEGIAFYRGEEREKGIADSLFIRAQDEITRRQLWVFHTAFYEKSFGMIADLFPCVIAGSRYFRGTMSYGALHQARLAFSHVLESVNFVQRERSTLQDMFSASYRVGNLLAKLNDMKELENDKVTSITYSYSQATAFHFHLKELSVPVPDSQEMIIRNLTLPASLAQNSHEGVLRLLVVGNSGVGKSGLMRAIAGLWSKGIGEVARPADEECMFLPQRPYMPQGDLRTQLLYPQDRCNKLGAAFDDKSLRRLLALVDLEMLPDRFEGGFNAVEDWARVLSSGEQQRVASVRCFVQRPKLMVLDEATSALSTEGEEKYYENISSLGLSYISVGHRATLLSYHDHVLELQGAGQWKFWAAEDYASKRREEQLAIESCAARRRTALAAQRTH